MALLSPIRMGAPVRRQGDAADNHVGQGRRPARRDGAAGGRHPRRGQPPSDLRHGVERARPTTVRERTHLVTAGAA